MHALDNKLIAVVASGLLSSAVLLAAAAQPPAVSVSELWDLGEDASLTVWGILVSLRTYESGSEVIVLSDGEGRQTVKVVCSVGPGDPPSAGASVGDMLEVTGECAFEDGVPTVYSHYQDVRVVRQSAEVLTVSLLSVAWHLFEGDRITVEGVAARDASGALRLWDPDGGCSVELRLAGAPAVTGPVTTDCTLVMDRATMALVLEVHSVAAIV